MTATTLFTLGYEGRTQDEALDLLSAHGVRVLVDVRAVPLSRKPGFSKRVLGASCEARGIRYVHLPALGTPKAGRIAARAGRAAEMAAIFEAHLATESAQQGLAEAAAIAGEGGACLLCFEREPHLCHRRIVAERICRNVVDL